MDRHIETLLRRISWVAIFFATLTLVLLIIQTLQTCIPPAPHNVHMKFPKSSCDSLHRQRLPLEKKNQCLWSTKTWIHKLHTHMHFFQQLQNMGYLSNDSGVICVSAGAGHEVMALNQMGVNDVTGIELMDTPPLVSKADPHNLPFFDEMLDMAYTAHLTEALYPLRFADEIERTMSNGGLCVVVVEQCEDDELKEIVGLFRKSKIVEAVNITFNGAQMTQIVMRRTRVSA